MNKKITSKIVLLTFVLLPLAAHSAAFMGTKPASAPVATPAPVNPNAAPSIQQGSNKTGSSNGSASALNLATGAIFIGMGYNLIKTAGPNHMQIAMGVMMVIQGVGSIAQGQQQGKTASAAYGASGSTYGGLGANSYDTKPDTTLPDAIKNDSKFIAAKSIVQDLKDKGLLTPNGGAKINGKNYSASDLSSPAAMAAAGIPKSMIDGLTAASAEAEKRALAKIEKLQAGVTAANGYEEGGGGGGAGAVNADSSDPAAYGGAGGGRGGLGKKGFERDPSSLAGMSKNYNGEPIGVAADSIFLMMTRRYKVKESQESFFSPADLALQK